MYLPDDIILLILARLSVKSLVRFKCVCKSWHSLIKSPILIDKHLSLSHDRTPEQLIMKTYRRPNNKKTILSFHSIDELLRVTAPDLEVLVLGSNLWYEDCVFRGSCNGIVCITINRTIILCNPALREFRTLPPTAFGCTHEPRCEIFLLSIGYGFGFDQVSNDYKVVCISRCRPERWDRPHSAGDGSWRAQVYNLKTDSWRETKVILPQQLLPSSSSFSIFSCFGTLVNGCFHWLAWDGVRVLFILSFHISTEEIGIIQRPSTNFLHKTLAALHESLAFIAWTEQGNFEVWIMNRYGFEESWTRQYFIHAPIAYLGFQFYVQRDNTFLVRGTDGRWVSFSFRTDQNQQQLLRPYDIRVYPTSLDHQGSLDSAIYKESLVSITRD